MRFTEEYKRYIKSPQWAAKRQYIMAKRGGRCEACGSQQNLKVHHGRYDTLMRERWQDCFVLCQAHHLGLHAEHRKAGRPELYMFTMTYIKKIKNRR